MIRLGLSFTHCALKWRHMEIWTNTGSGHGLMPDSTKPLPETILTYHQSSLVASIWEKFPKKCSRWQSVKWGNHTFEITVTSPMRKWVYSLWPSDTIWHHRNGSTLGQVMAYCLTAPSHNLTQCWLISNEAFPHLPEGNFTRKAQTSYPWYEFENN